MKKSECNDALKWDKQTGEETDEKGMQEMIFFERNDALKRDKQLGRRQTRKGGIKGTWLNQHQAVNNQMICRLNFIGCGLFLV